MIDSLVRSCSQQCSDRLLMEPPLQFPALSSCGSCCSHGSGARVWTPVSFSCILLTHQPWTLKLDICVSQERKEREGGKSLRWGHLERPCRFISSGRGRCNPLLRDYPLLLSFSPRRLAALRATIVYRFHVNAQSSVARSRRSSSPAASLLDQSE